MSRPASAFRSGRAEKRAGIGARGRPTWAMPEPINPPPMTVTCLTRIFFAEAAAVEEDMERTNCLVTKAMVQKAKAATGTGPGGEATCTQPKKELRADVRGRGPRSPGARAPWASP